MAARPASGGRTWRRGLALAVGAACVLPFAYLALLASAGPWPFPRLLPEGLEPGRWLAALGGQGGLGASLAVSLAISCAVALVSTVAGYAAAKHIAYHAWRERLMLLAYVPFAMSPVILGTCLLHLYIKLGLAGGLAGVVMAQAIFALGFAVVFFADFWGPRMRAFEELVYTLGGGRRQAYWRVLVPLSKGMLLICFFQTFLISWFQYGLTLLVGAGKVQTLPLKVYDYVNEANPYWAAVAACLLVAPPVVLLWLNKRYLFKAV